MLSGTEPLELSQALLVALSGFVTVFLMLGTLAILIIIVSKIVDAIESKKKPVAVATKNVTAPAVVSVQPAQDEDELVAVLVAAIAEETNSSPNSFRITNIQSR